MSFVYFIIESPFTGKVKIGKSDSPQARLKTLQTGNPNKLEIHGVVPCDNAFGLETTLHNKYNSRRLNGEWFTMNKDEIDECIKNIASIKNEASTTAKQRKINHTCPECGEGFNRKDKFFNHKKSIHGIGKGINYLYKGAALFNNLVKTEVYGIYERPVVVNNITNITNNYYK